jgi:hypothetical protein
VFPLFFLSDGGVVFFVMCLSWLFLACILVPMGNGRLAPIDQGLGILVGQPEGEEEESGSIVMIIGVGQD